MSAGEDRSAGQSKARRGYELFPWLPVLAGEIVRLQMRTNFGLSELTVGGQCKDMQ